MNDATEYWQAVRDYNKEREYFLEQAKEVSGKLEIRLIKQGMRGLFTHRTFNKGEIILLLKGNYFNKPTRTSIQVGNSKHVENYEGGLINHHCNPSANIIIIPDVEPAIVVANKTIFKGEEITFDYETTEEFMAEPFKCECHGKLIEGWNSFPRT
jgi:SET domain-containing protein